MECNLRAVQQLQALPHDALKGELFIIYYKPNSVTTDLIHNIIKLEEVAVTSGEENEDVLLMMN